MFSLMDIAMSQVSMISKNILFQFIILKIYNRNTTTKLQSAILNF